MLEIVKSAVARDTANKRTELTTFTGGIRDIDATSFEVNDVFIIEVDFPVLENKINGTPVQYTKVPVTTAAGQTVVKDLYPTYFTRVRNQVDENGDLIDGGRVHTLGTAAEFYRKFTSVQEGMKALASVCAKGLKIKINKLQKILIMPMGVIVTPETKPTHTYIPTIDFVKDDGTVATVADVEALLAALYLCTSEKNQSVIVTM